MIKLFAILTVLAALPVSALAKQAPTPSEGIACKKDAPDTYAVQHEIKVDAQGSTKDASLAN